MRKPILDDNQLDYFKKNVKGKSTIEIQKLILNKYNINLTQKQILNLKYIYKVKSGVKYWKNKKPHNYKPVGSEYMRKDGYIFIKISDNPKIWQRKNRYIYEQHYGKIPEGYDVIFLDQNKTNYNINNLKLISKNEKLSMCNNRLFFKYKELTQTGILIQRLINKTKQIKKY